MLSRREFLKRAVVIAGSTAITPINRANGYGESITIADFALASHGRAFRQTVVYALPDAKSPAIAELMPDEVVDISWHPDSSYYKVLVGDLTGYVPREGLQPILPYQRPAIVETVGNGFWAELIAPTSVSRAWCAPTAPMVGRFHFGAMVYVVDRLVDDRGTVWYGLAGGDTANHSVHGWVTALQYQGWISPEPEDSATLQQRVEIDTRQRCVLVYDQRYAQKTDGDRLIAQIPLYTAQADAAGTTLEVVAPGNAWGLPWIMRLGSGQLMTGTFAHNRFGMRPEPADGLATIDLPTFGARWLYESLLHSGGTTRAIIV